MFMNDVYKKDEIKDVAVQDLRKIGVKFRLKKPKPLAVQDIKKTKKCFKVDLNMLPTQVVTLNDGQQLIVPIIVHELCSFILKQIETEGLFRKEGSKPRQNEIKLSLNAGCKIDDDCHVIDVAGILKTFLRELPEPLIPKYFHEYFLRSMILTDKKLDAVLLLCLLLPQEHLNTLAYLLRFFKIVAENSDQNRMTSVNLSIVISPNIIPIVQDKSSMITQNRIKKMCELVQMLIENSDKVGIIPIDIIDRVATENEEMALSMTDKKKKRRSGSLTRMFNGLKKIVGNKFEEISPTTNIITPDLLLTPSITRSTKKRKIETVTNAGLSNKKKKEVISKLPENNILKTPFAPTSTPICSNPNAWNEKKTAPEKAKEKKSQWYSKNKNKISAKTTLQSENKELRSSRSSLNGPRALIERRWSAVSNVPGFRRKKRNSTEKPCEINENDEDFVKISKTEYEEIKQRVSEIERRISIEIERKLPSPPPLASLENVQTAYEQTLHENKPMSPTTDHLARRLSKELKIRRNSERIVRSPSERKIERRRRSLSRNSGNTSQISTRSSNSNFHSVDEGWTSAERFFSTVKTPKTPVENDTRPSIVEIRNQNAGMVMARAKLFDNLTDDSDETKNKTKISYKIGGSRRHSERLRKMDNERRKKISPRNRKMYLRTPEKGAIASSPKIKKPLMTKSPKRLCRSPYNVDRCTPLKVLPSKSMNL